MIAWCSMLHSIKCVMQHDLALKKLNFDPSCRVGVLRAKYLLSSCCISDSLSFDMSHDHILIFFYLLTPFPRVVGGGGGGERGGLRAKYWLPCF